MSGKIEVTGIWSRRRGDNIETLVEVGGTWRVAISERYDGAFSHIAEPSGADKWPNDPVTS